MQMMIRSTSAVGSRILFSASNAFIKMALLPLLRMAGTFDELVEIMARLRGPNGCPWDHEQTFKDYPQHIREEAEELFAAFDSGDVEHMKEEIGDLIWTLIFFSQIAKDEGLFTIEDSLKDIKEKIIRRHPHIFGDAKVSSAEEVIKTWNKIKEKERKAKK